MKLKLLILMMTIYNWQSAKDYQYETILLASGILNRRGNLLCISRQHIEELQREVQENITLQYSKAKVQRNGTHNYYIYIGEPINRDPIMQSRTPIPIANRRVEHGQQLPRRHQLLIEHLCFNHQQAENDNFYNDDEADVPFLVEETVVDDQRDEGVDNQELANLLLQLGEEVEPMRVQYEAEEEEEGQQQQQQPYQLTPHYRE
jgi:hypothetical protein